MKRPRFHRASQGGYLQPNVGPDAQIIRERIT
jgi:hypothetical protein